MTKQEIFTYLNNPKVGKTWRVSFFDLNGTKITDTIKKELHENGGIYKKLESLYLEGHNTIEIKLHRSDGPGRWRLICAKAFKLKGKGKEDIEETTLIKTPKTPKKTMEAVTHTPPPSDYAPAPNVGLMGVGLGQYLDAYSGNRMLQVTQKELNELKSKYEALMLQAENYRNEIFDLKRQKERLEDKLEQKSFLDNIDVNAVLPALVGLLKPNPAASGLNSPANQPELQGYKKLLRDQIQTSEFPDTIAEKLYNVLEQFANNNSAFVQEFYSLLNQHNLKKSE